MPPEIVEKAVQERLLQTGKAFDDANDLFDACIMLETKITARPGTTELEHRTKGYYYIFSRLLFLEYYIIILFIRAIPLFVFVFVFVSFAPELTLGEGTTNKQTCKICMDEPMNVVFLPCGHYICCVNCALNVVNCPNCREKIRATVKTYT